MIYQICLWAKRLDEWLQERLGRPYNFVLGVGLVSEIIQQSSRLGSTMRSAPSLIAALLILAVEFALLLHQIGALAHHIERRRARRAKAVAPKS